MSLDRCIISFYDEPLCKLSVQSFFRPMFRYPSNTMIKSFHHKGLESLFLTGDMIGIRPDHASKLRRLLSRLAVARCDQDMNLAGLKLHALSGESSGHYSVMVRGSWRLSFAFDGADAILVDFRDFH